MSSTDLGKMTMEQRWKVATDRIARSKAEGKPVCEHLWETVQHWDPCTNGGAQFSEPKMRACGHTVCGQHILLHGMMFCPQAGMQAFGFTSTAAVEVDKAMKGKK